MSYKYCYVCGKVKCGVDFPQKPRGGGAKDTCYDCIDNIGVLCYCCFNRFDQDDICENRACVNCRTKINRSAIQLFQVKNGSEKVCDRCGFSYKRSKYGYDYSTYDMHKPECNYCLNGKGFNTRDWHLKVKYGIGQKEFEMMADRQEWKCSICNDPESELERGLVVDHCHNTGKIRGLLCHKCNSGIGFFNDDIRRLYGAINYLEENNIYG